MAHFLPAFYQLRADFRRAQSKHLNAIKRSSREQATRKEMEQTTRLLKESDFFIADMRERKRDVYHVAFLFTLGNKSFAGHKAKRFSPLPRSTVIIRIIMPCSPLCHSYKERTGAYTLAPPPFLLDPLYLFPVWAASDEERKGKKILSASTCREFFAR